MAQGCPGQKMMFGACKGNSTGILTLQARVCLSEAADGHHELGTFDKRLQGDDLGRYCGKGVAG